MKTLVINGATRNNGDTSYLLGAFLDGLDGDITVLSSDDKISPCIDCRRCKNSDSCSIDDKMTEIYAEMPSYDNIVIASPVWFSSLSGPALDIASRFQTVFCAGHFRGEKQSKKRNGVIILTGGRQGSEKGAVASAKVILSCLGVPSERIFTVTSMNTDAVPAKNDALALELARKIAKELIK